VQARRMVRRALAATLAGGLGLLATATPAFAPHVAQMQVTPSTAKPGDEVTVFGPRGYGLTNPVQVRWGSVNGPVLGEFPTRDGAFAMWGPGTITIPEDAKPGINHLWVTQQLEPNESHIRGVPVQTVIQITDASGAAPVVGQELNPLQERPADLIENEAVSGTTLLLIGLGAAGIAMFLAGAAAVVVGRRRDTAQAVTR
jgi:hypothetical protein